MEKKYGVYICKGCGIGDSINIEKLAKTAKHGPVKEENIKIHDVMCGPEALQMIKNDIKKDGLNTIVIAACSPRVKYEEFDFPGLHNRAREHTRIRRVDAAAKYRRHPEPGG